MIYLVLVYIAFQVMFEQWGQDTVNSKIIYFAFQYGWIASLLIMQALKGKYYIFYWIFALIMTVISLNEFRAWNKDETTYSMMVSPPAISIFSIVVGTALVLLLTTSKLKRWNGLNEISK